METKEAIQLVIRDLMMRYGLSQAGLAARIGVSQKVVSNWLNGVDMPKSSSLVAVYEAFGVTPNEMLGIESYGVSEAGFSAEEAELLRRFRAMNDSERRRLLAGLFP